MKRVIMNKYVILIGISIFLQNCTEKQIVKTYTDPTPYKIVLPKHMPILDIPEDNPLTIQGIELGRKLFYDPLLSGDGTQSCSSCHQIELGFADKDRFSIGIDKIRGTRRSMPLINVGYMKKLFWDGRAKGLEDQATFPVVDPIEMHNVWTDAVKSVAENEHYPDLFGAAFGSDKVTKDRIVKAIAQFERTFISAKSKYDRVLYDKTAYFTDDELEGYLLFYDEDKGDCFHCHDGGLMTDNFFHNNGLDAEFKDIGRSKVSKDNNDEGKFKTPTLRNVALRAPYMHDGRFASLKEVLDHYSEGLVQSETIDPLMKSINKGGVHLSEEEKWQIIAFLNTMTDSTFVNNPSLKSPF